MNSAVYSVPQAQCRAPVHSPVLLRGWCLPHRTSSWLHPRSALTLLCVPFWDRHWWQRFRLPFPPSQHCLNPLPTPLYVSSFCLHCCSCMYMYLYIHVYSQTEAVCSVNATYVFWADCGTGHLVCFSLVWTVHFGKFMAVLILILWLLEPSCPLSLPVFTGPWYEWTVDVPWGWAAQLCTWIACAFL